MGAHAPPVAHGRLPAACVCRDAKPGLVGRRGPPRQPRLPYQPPTTLFPVRSSLAPAQPERSPGPPWDPASRDMTRTCSLYSATGALLIRRGGAPPADFRASGDHDKKRSWSDASERNTQKRGGRSEAHWLLASRRLRLVPMVGRKRMGRGLFGTGTRKGVTSNGRRRQSLGRGEVAAIEFEEPPADSLAPPLAREAAARISGPFLFFL